MTRIWNWQGYYGYPLIVVTLVIAGVPFIIAGSGGGLRTGVEIPLEILTKER